MGNLLSDNSISVLRQMVRDFRGNPRGPRKPRIFTQKVRPILFVPFPAIVTGVDVNTWGGGRKLLSAQRLTSRPLGYGGPTIYADGWIDSMIVCGQEVLIFPCEHVAGDPPDVQINIALPITAVEQKYLVAPNPAYVATVPDPVVPFALDPCFPVAAP